MQKKQYTKKIVLINNKNEDEIKDKIKKVEQLAKRSSFLILTEYKLELNTLLITTDFVCSCKDLEIPISPEQIKSIIKDVLGGLRDLENENLYHGSIKPSNILCGGESFKLCHYYLKGITDSYFANIETVKYQSPEAIKSDELSIKSDMWSLGCVIFYLFNGSDCFVYSGSVKDLAEKIVKFKKNTPSSNAIDNTIQELIDNLIVENVENRYYINDVYEKLEITNAEINEKKDIVYLKCNKYVTDYKCKQNGVYYHIRVMKFCELTEDRIRSIIGHDFGCAHILQSEIVSIQSGTITIKRLFLPYSLEERKEFQLPDSTFKYSIINALLKAIKSLHSYGIIHGNINPSNVLLDDKNDVFLTDYFMSSLYHNKNYGHSFPMISMYYQSPNRLLNKELSEDDDLWSFAMILFYLTDNLPSDSKNILKIYKITRKLANEKINPTSDIFITLTAHDLVRVLSNKNKNKNKNESINKDKNKQDEDMIEKPTPGIDYLIRRFSNVDMNNNIDYMLGKNINVFSVVDCFGMNYLLVPQSALNEKILDCIITIFNSTMSNSIFRFLVREFPKTHLNDMIKSIEDIFSSKKKKLKITPPQYSYIFYSPNYRIINPSSSYDKCYELFHKIVDIVQSRKITINSSSDVEYYFYEAYLKYIKLKSLNLSNINNRIMINVLIRNIREQQDLESLCIKGIKDYKFNYCLISSLKFLTNLKELYLIDMRIDCDFIESITRLDKLRILNLDNSIRYSDDISRRFYHGLNVCLSNIEDLEELNLSGDYYGGDSMKDYCQTLTKFRNLRSIKLTSCFMECENGFDLLSSTFPFYNLEVLDVRDNLLGDTGIATIANHTNDLLSLKILLLDKNMISDEGIKIWKYHLKRLQHLEIFSISHNNITTEGLKEIENDLKYLRKLTNFDFSYNDLSYGEAFSTLDGIFRSLRYLEYININYVVFYKSMNKNKNKYKNIKETFSSSYREYGSYNNYNDYSDYSDYSEIQLNSVEISQSFYNSLEKVICFQLAGNELKSSSIATIFYNNRLLFKNIKELDLSDNYIGDNPSEFADLLEKMINLKTLNLSNNGLSEKGIRELADCFPSLSYLDLSKNSIKDNGLKTLCNNGDLFNSLSYLDLSNNELTDKSMNDLFSRSLYLTSLKLDFNDIHLNNDNDSAISNMSSLKELSIGFNPISNDKLFKSLRSLQELNIKGTNIKKEDNIDSLYDANTHLLNMNQYISNDDKRFTFIKKGIDYNQSIMISNGLSRHLFINELNLEMNNINDESMKILSRAIQFLRYLEIINLSYNSITELGFIYFASKIKYLLNLKRIDIRYEKKERINEVTEDGKKKC